MKKHNTVKYKKLFSHIKMGKKNKHLVILKPKSINFTAIIWIISI